MRKTLNVIRSECEGSVPVVRKAVRCHQSDSEESIAVIRKPVSVIREMVRLDEIYRSSQKRNTISRGREIYGRIGKNRKA